MTEKNGMFMLIVAGVLGVLLVLSVGFTINSQNKATEKIENLEKVNSKLEEEVKIFEEIKSNFEEANSKSKEENKDFEEKLRNIELSNNELEKELEIKNQLIKVMESYDLTNGAFSVLSYNQFLWDEGYEIYPDMFFEYKAYYDDSLIILIPEIEELIELLEDTEISDVNEELNSAQDFEELKDGYLLLQQEFNRLGIEIEDN